MLKHLIAPPWLLMTSMWPCQWRGRAAREVVTVVIVMLRRRLASAMVTTTALEAAVPARAYQATMMMAAAHVMAASATPKPLVVVIPTAGVRMPAAPVTAAMAATAGADLSMMAVTAMAVRLEPGTSAPPTASQTQAARQLRQRLPPPDQTHPNRLPLARRSRQRQAWMRVARTMELGTQGAMRTATLAASAARLLGPGPFGLARLRAVGCRVAVAATAALATPVAVQSPLVTAWTAGRG